MIDTQIVCEAIPFGRATYINQARVHQGYCPVKPITAFPYMANLARKYILDEYEFMHRKSLFSMKPILVSSEIDDSRPTIIRKYSESPTFIGVLSGKLIQYTIWMRC